VATAASIASTSAVVLVEGAKMMGGGVDMAEPPEMMRWC
jgi:hypothetical protein